MASPANLARFQARLSDALVTKQVGHTPSVVFESPRANFEALLTEEEVNASGTIRVRCFSCRAWLA